jgi:hypothetical protein
MFGGVLAYKSEFNSARISTIKTPFKSFVNRCLQIAVTISWSKVNQKVEGVFADVSD